MTVERVRALSVTQPWASLLATGLKRYETRSWQTPYRGTLLIHATKKWDYDELEELSDHADALRELGYYDPSELPTGALIAIGTLIGCKPADEIGHDLQVDDDWFELEAGFFAPGRWAWEIEVKPNHTCLVPARGSQGIWVPETSVIADARGQVLDNLAALQ